MRQKLPQFSTLSPVNFLQDLEQYLTGQIETSNAIEFLIPELDLSAPLEGLEVEAAPSKDGQAPVAATDGHKPDAEEAMLKRVLAGELQLRDRNSMLAVPGRNFLKVLAILKSVQSSARTSSHRTSSSGSKTQLQKKVLFGLYDTDPHSETKRRHQIHRYSHVSLMNLHQQWEIGVYTSTHSSFPHFPYN